MISTLAPDTPLEQRFRVATNGLWLCVQRIDDFLRWQNVSTIPAYSNIPARFDSMAEADRVCDYLKAGNMPLRFDEVAAPVVSDADAEPAASTTGDFQFTESELHAMRNHPGVLSILMDFREACQTEADAIWGGEEGCPNGDEERKKVLFERGRSLVSEDPDIWPNELRVAFGFPPYVGLIEALDAELQGKQSKPTSEEPSSILPGDCPATGEHCSWKPQEPDGKVMCHYCHSTPDDLEFDGLFDEAERCLSVLEEQTRFNSAVSPSIFSRLRAVIALSELRSSVELFPPAPEDSLLGLDDDTIRAVFMKHGFKIQQGKPDLDAAFYSAAKEIIWRVLQGRFTPAEHELMRIYQRDLTLAERASLLADASPDARGASKSGCSPTSTECPRCRNDFTKCDAGKCIYLKPEAAEVEVPFLYQHALEELHQLGYTVVNGDLLPPTKTPR